MRILVTGCAGFIGSNLVDRLLLDGHEVIGFDNLSTGHLEFLEQARSSAQFQFLTGDILQLDQLRPAMLGVELVFHLAANADVRHGTDDPTRDLEQNTLGTFNVLETMRATGVHRIAFSSSGAVYGEPDVFPTPEDAPFPVQTSLYGASKLACEALISAYSAGYGFAGTIFRFVSILGRRYQHGHVIDFYRSLLADPTAITVLGDGMQRKSYLDVDDCIRAVTRLTFETVEGVEIYNLGNSEHCTVDESLNWITAELGLNPRRAYAGGRRGWVGDSPFVFLDTSRAQAQGWGPKVSVREAVLRTVAFLEKNHWLLERSGRVAIPSGSERPDSRSLHAREAQ